MEKLSTSQMRQNGLTALKSKSRRQRTQAPAALSTWSWMAKRQRRHARRCTRASYIIGSAKN